MMDPSLVYPAPSLVVGLGRFGLAVVERLGEDWQQLKLSGGGPSLKNLRLLWLHAEDDQDRCWREHEIRRLQIARYMHDGDLPSLVLDFVLLRTLGLIRYHHGMYQVAVPQDRGAIRARDLRLNRDEGGEAPREKREDRRFRRRRFFEWQDLKADPVEAADELRRQVERRASLHLFVAPLLHRIRQGHSPWVLLACILRSQCLAEGRDPSPWRWIRKALDGEPETPANGLWTIPREAIAEARKRRKNNDWLMTRYAPFPLRPKPGLENLENAPEWEFEDDAKIQVPATFLPQESDPEAPIDPFHLLQENWQTAGWATENTDAQQDHLQPLKISHFRLGLFDNAGARSEGQETFTEEFEKRLRYLAGLVQRGLVRLYVDLQREQVEENTVLPSQRRHEDLDEALQQSLALLRGALITPLEGEESEREKAEGWSRRLDCPLMSLPAEPTRFLSSRRLDPDPRWLEESALERRLAALGLEDPGRRMPLDLPLLRNVVMRPSHGSQGLCNDLGVPQRHTSETAEERGAGPGEKAEEPDDGSLGLRKTLNEEVRALLDFSYLAEYRKRPTRTPPRLTVFVVGDMSEPFTRLKMTETLRDVHSELLRAFSSMFELHREGFDRALSVVPLLWMAHPADPFGGAKLEETRLEEAVIIEAVHGVRRWVESVLPGARRRISQIFVNGRVTDNAVLTVEDSIRQTRDFIAFQVRNDLSQDEWLRRTAVGPGGDDFFASFACCEIEFPAERAREYLANRLARDCLHKLRSDAQWRGREAIQLPQPAATEELVGEAQTTLKRTTGQRADELADRVWHRVGPNRTLPRCITRQAVEGKFDRAFEEDLWGGVQSLWAELTQRRGGMDDVVDRLRHLISRKLRGALPEIRRHSDDDIEQVSAFGLPAVLSRLEERRRGAFRGLQDTEGERRVEEGHCKRHDIPRRRPLTAAREEVVEAARGKPDCAPQRLGLLAWLLMAPATAAFLATLVLPWIGLGSLPVMAGLLFALAWVGLWQYTRVWHRRLMAAVKGLAAAVHRLVAGSGDKNLASQATSLRSFLEMRVLLTSALARRGYSLHVYEQTAVDEGLGQRLRESVDIQEHRMIRRAEALGVRPAPPGAEEKDDLRSLFVRRHGGRMERLIEGDHLEDYYSHRVRPEELPVRDFLEASGGLAEWRKHACLAGDDAVMQYGRTHFKTVATRPITQLDYFSDRVGHHLREFVNRNYSNLGFGAKFAGYEGLDPDGVRLVADAALVADQPMLQAYERAEERTELQEEPTDQLTRRSRTLDRIPCGVRPNAAYMLSLVQGVRAHSVHNLKRFESFHDRTAEPVEAAQPIHALTGYEDVLNEHFRFVRDALKDSFVQDAEAPTKNESEARPEGAK